MEKMKKWKKKSNSKGNRFVVYYADVNLVEDGFFKASVCSKKEFHFSREFQERVVYLIRMETVNGAKYLCIGMTVVFRSISKFPSDFLLYIQLSSESKKERVREREANKRCCSDYFVLQLYYSVVIIISSNTLAQALVSSTISREHEHSLTFSSVTGPHSPGRLNSRIYTCTRREDNFGCPIAVSLRTALKWKDKKTAKKNSIRIFFQNNVKMKINRVKSLVN